MLKHFFNISRNLHKDYNITANTNPCGSWSRQTRFK